MPSNPYTENEEKWKSLSDIDWFTQFIKAWITFNAWYRNSYPSLITEREIINEIKNNANSVRIRAESYLSRADVDSSKFKQHIADLYKLLEEKIINNRGKRVQLLGENKQAQEIFVRRGIIYESTKLPNQEIISLVKNSSNHIIIEISQSKYDRNGLINNIDYKNRLSAEQQKNLLACYKVICPEMPLLSSGSDALNIGDYQFVNDPPLISQAIIETIYKLRCVLFHGKIVPDKDIARIYEPAYHILKMLVG
jgi:hypothetical protein